MAKASTSTMTTSKRLKPPNLTLSRDRPAPIAAIQIEADVESPVLRLSDDEDEDDDGLLRLGSDNSSPSHSPMAPISNLDSSDDEADAINKDLAALEQLRRSVQKNLRLRPIRSHSSLSTKMRLAGGSPFSPFSPPSMTSPASSTASSYFTPLTDARSSPTSASDSSSMPRSPSPKQSLGSSSNPVDAGQLYSRLTSPTRPLLIDTRPPAVHLAFHIAHSVPLAIPSLILKRCRKPGGGFPSLDSLTQFITTEQGKRNWQQLMQPGGDWDGDVIVYDEEMDVRDKENLAAPAWALLPVIAPLLSFGSADYLLGGIGSAGHHPDLETLIVSDSSRLADEPFGGRAGVGNGVFQLDTSQPFHPKSSLEVEISQSASSTYSSINSNTPPRSPLPMMSSVMPGSGRRITKTADPNSTLVNIMDATPSPPPSQAGFRRPPPPQRRPSAPNLRRLDTKSAERLNAIPKLQVRTVPIKSATLSVPSLSFNHPPSPSHLNLAYSNHTTPPASANHWVTSPTSPTSDLYSAYFTPPHTPTAHNRFPSGSSPYISSAPSTARQDDPPSTEEPFSFSVSTILPGFLFLGPELTTAEHVVELQSLGVRRILNIAAECEDELKLSQTFERYVKIPMRDTVEEDGIARGVREVCDILDDARLHSAPTYVHCKAGKSRSVTAVIAYLIHANHWTLSRAYQFVLERRKGISPNIGFVSELMTFEEEELGGKSIGVQPAAAGGETAANGDTGGYGGSYGVASGGRRGGHVRESLPPEALSAGGLEHTYGDSAQEMEIRDATGRYRHARRAPVNENTLQPMRRVSKAGLESSAYNDVE